jgi:hypothetical protein
MDALDKSPPGDCVGAEKTDAPEEHPLTSGETRRALQRLIHASEGLERLTIGQMLEALGRSGHGLVLMVLALPGFIPIPGLPTGFIFGTALVLVAAQIIRGREQLILPHWLARWSVPSSSVQAMVKRLDRWLEKVARRLRPRLTGLTEGVSMTIVAGIVLLMGMVIVMPVPLGNPSAAIAIVVFAFGMMERDGVAILAGVVLSVVSVAWNVTLILFGAAIAGWLWSSV